MTTGDLIALGITSESVLLVFSWGFASVLTMWGLGFGIGCVLTLIRKV